MDLSDGFLISLAADNVIIASPTKPTHVKTCPPPTNVFTGRADIVAQLDDYFMASPTSFESGTQRVFVLYGLGGAGKSQCAFKFVAKCQVHRPCRYDRFVDLYVEPLTLMFVQILEGFPG